MFYFFKHSIHSFSMVFNDFNISYAWGPESLVYCIWWCHSRWMSPGCLVLDCNVWESYEPKSYEPKIFSKKDLVLFLSSKEHQWQKTTFALPNSAVKVPDSVNFQATGPEQPQPHSLSLQAPTLSHFTPFREGGKFVMYLCHLLPAQPLINKCVLLWFSCSTQGPPSAQPTRLPTFAFYYFLKQFD